MIAVLQIAATNLPRSDDDYAVDSEPLAHGDRAESTRKNPERGLIKRAPDQLVDEQKTVSFDVIPIGRCIF